MSFMPIIEVFFNTVAGVWAIAILLFVMLRLLGNPDRQRRRFGLLVLHAIPFLESVVILGAILWTAWLLLAERPLVYFACAGIVLVFTAWSFRALLQDLAAGIVLRSGSLMQPGQDLIIDGNESRVVSMGPRSITVVRPDRNYMKIPYSYLASTPFTIPAEKDLLQSHQFTVSISTETPADTAAEKLRKLAINAPWSPARPQPRVILESSDDHLLTFAITVFSIDSRHFSRIEDRIKTGFQNQPPPA